MKAIAQDSTRYDVIIDIAGNRPLAGAARAIRDIASGHATGKGVVVM
jgi:hypothetical protein